MMIRSKMGVEGRGETVEAMWADWSRKAQMRPFTVIRNRFGRYRRICESAVPMGKDVVSITYPDQHSARIRF